MTNEDFPKKNYSEVCETHVEIRSLEIVLNDEQEKGKNSFADQYLKSPCFLSPFSVENPFICLTLKKTKTNWKNGVNVWGENEKFFFPIITWQVISKI